MAATDFTCVKILTDAIRDLGVQPISITVHEDTEPSIVQQRVEVHIATGRIMFSKQDDETFCVEMSDFVKNSGPGRKFVAKAMGGTGELDQHYAKRAVLKAIANNYGHKLKSCKWQNGKIQIRVSVR